MTRGGHGSQRRDRIHLDDPRDVFFWTALWGLTDQELRDAVMAVGPVPADVAAHLGQPLEGAAASWALLPELRARLRSAR